MSPEVPPFKTMRFGFADRIVYRSVPATPRVGDLAWQEHQLAVLALQTVRPAVGDGRREELGAQPGDWIVRREWHYLPDCRHGFGPDEDCERHSILTYAERAAARALYEAPLDVGREGIGGFAAGQAEETILALRLAGFPIDGAGWRLHEALGLPPGLEVSFSTASVLADDAANDAAEPTHPDADPS